MGLFILSLCVCVCVCVCTDLFAHVAVELRLHLGPADVPAQERIFVHVSATE